MKFLPFKIEKDYLTKKLAIQVKYQGKEKNYFIEEIITILFKKLLELATNHLKQEIRDIAISIPAYYGLAEIYEIKDIAKKAGFNVRRIISKSLASGLYYCYENNFKEQRNILVINFSSGVIESCLLTINEGKIAISAKNNSTKYNGEELILLLIGYCCLEFKTKTSIDIANNKKVVGRIRKYSEKLMSNLSFSSESSIDIESLCEGKEIL